MALEFFAAKIHADPAESHEFTGSATIIICHHRSGLRRQARQSMCRVQPRSSAASILS